jgi:chemotaxis protein methyltransferase CheR
VNCAALPPDLVESELFGHERGAFTGAERRREGRFELADGGTLLLDEVGDLPAEVQPKLLRVLQDGAFERVGGTSTLQVDVRVVAATNRDLRQDVEEGRFREDLYYRLEVYPITIPPLRDRREDIPLLVEHFAKQIAGRRGVRIDEVPAELMRRLEAYDWPGNVRELQNVAERAVLVSTGGVLRLAEPLTETPSELATFPRTPGAMRPRPTLDELERDYISEVLEDCGGRIAGAGGAAEVLGLHPNTLRSRMKKLGVAASRTTRDN